MLIKCACNNCSAHLEFESGNEGTVITCPSCMLETKLYAPAPTPIKPIAPTSNPTPKPIPKQAASTAIARVVEELRGKSSYPFMRSLIETIYRAHILLAALSGIIGVFVLGAGFAKGAELAIHIVSFIGAVSLGLFFIVLGKLWKEASSVILDIADCQIELLKSRTPPAK